MKCKRRLFLALILRLRGRDLEKKMSFDWLIFLYRYDLIDHVVYIHGFVFIHLARLVVSTPIYTDTVNNKQLISFIFLISLSPFCLKKKTCVNRKNVDLERREY